MLRIQTKSVMPGIELSVFSFCIRQKISRVKLKAGLVSEHLHHAPGFRFKHACSRRNSFAAAVQHKIMIVAARDAELRDVSADGFGLCEIKRRAFDRFNFTKPKP